MARLSLVIAGAILLLAGCGDGGGTPSDEPLTTTHVREAFADAGFPLEIMDDTRREDFVWLTMAERPRFVYVVLWFSAAGREAVLSRISRSLEVDEAPDDAVEVIVGHGRNFVVLATPLLVDGVRENYPGLGTGDEALAEAREHVDVALEHLR